MNFFNRMRQVFVWGALPLMAVSLSQAATNDPPITVAAYYYPCEHTDPRWDKAKYPGFTEWDLIRKAKPRFPGHQQPKVPVWGYTDEADPKVMAQKIGTAADYGVNAFIFDWYYYDDGPYLERALDQGFLGATNNNRIQFALMWANHDWYDIQGYNPADPVKLLYPGKVTAATWDKITDLIIARYFKHPSYWKIEGKPYFSIYDISVFLASFPTVKDFLSYCRLVKGTLASAGKIKGLRGAKLGNPYLRWSFGEAAVIAKRDHAVIGPLAQRLEARMNGNKFKAHTVVAIKLARAVYFMLKRKTVFDPDRLVAALSRN